MTAIRSAACLCLLAVCFFIYLPISQARTNPELIDNGDHCKKLLAQLWPLKSLMQRKNFLENAAHECPDNAMLQYYYGVNLERRLQYEKALRYYRLSLKLNSLFPPAYFGMGETYFSLGDETAAVQAYEKGLQIQPDNKWGAGRLREILAMQDRPAPLNDGSSRRGKTFNQQRSPNAYEKSIAGRYGIDLDTLIQTENRIASIKKIAGRYGIGLDELLQASAKTSGSEKRAGSAGQQDDRKKYLEAISRRYGIRTDELTRVSNQLSSVKEIAARYGIRLNDLMAGKETALSFEKKNSKKKKSPLITHNGKTLNRQGSPDAYEKSIAERYGIDLDTLIQTENRIASIKKIAGRYGIGLDELLQAGEKTFEPGKKADSAAAERQDAQKKYLEAISLRYGIRTDELTRISNQLSAVKEIAARYGIRLNDLMAGKETVLSFEKKNSKKKKSPLTTHKVRKNEYLSRIANRYGVSLDEILKANKEIDDPHWIFPGQVLVIPDKKR